MSKQINMSPMEANTLNKVLKLKRDNISKGDYWILTDGTNVCICNQRSGEQATQSISIPSKYFNRLIEWYITQQPLNK